MPRAKKKEFSDQATRHPEVRFSQETKDKLCQVLGIAPLSPPVQYTWKQLDTFMKKGEPVPGPQDFTSQVFEAIDRAIHKYQGLELYVDNALTPAQRKAALDPFLKSCQSTLDLFHELSSRDVFEDTLRPQVKSAKELERYTQTIKRFPLDLQTIIAMMQPLTRVSAEASKAAQTKPRKSALHHFIHDLSHIFNGACIPSNTKDCNSKKREFIHLILVCEGIDTFLTPKRLTELLLKTPLSL